MPIKRYSSAEEALAANRARTREKYRKQHNIPLDAGDTRGGAHNCKYSNEEEARQAKNRQSKEYRLRNTFDCECGKLGVTNQTNHERTKFHRDYLKSIICGEIAAPAETAGPPPAGNEEEIIRDTEPKRRRNEVIIDTRYKKCRCGKSYTITNKRNHDRTKFHINFLNSIICGEITAPAENEEETFEIIPAKKKKQRKYILVEVEVEEEMMTKWW